MSDLQITPPRNVVQLKRLQGASRRLQVVPRDQQRGLYWVESASQPGEVYSVELAPNGLEGRCSCAWAQHGGTNCKHILAALRQHYADEGTISFWASPSAARRQHRRTVAGGSLYATFRK